MRAFFNDGARIQPVLGCPPDLRRADLAIGQMGRQTGCAGFDVRTIAILLIGGDRAVEKCSEALFRAGGARLPWPVEPL